jgi:hypothetical protein
MPDAELAPRRSVLAGPLVAAITGVFALIAAGASGLPLRDPDHVVGSRLLLVVVLAAMLVVIDIVVRAAISSGRPAIPSRKALAEVRRLRWTAPRMLIVGSALVSFYVTYLAYRNLKSLVPVLRPTDLFDRQLAEADRALFGGNDPAEIMHDLLGTGIATDVLSWVYVAFLLFVPISLALALVFSRDLGRGLFFATALSINWALGALSYYLLPALGPIYAGSQAFSDLPTTPASDLQQTLLDDRYAFMRDPEAAGAAQGIAAFASLHVSVVFTAALAAHIIGLRRSVRIALWTLLALTSAATIHLGWHYVIDDVAGLFLGGAAVALAVGLTGYAPRSAPALSTRAGVETA